MTTKIDFESFINKTKPINVLELIDEKVLQHLLNGYSAALSAGLCIIFNPMAEDASLGTLKDITAFGKEVDKVFYPLCAHYRNQKECNCEKFCRDFDKEIALKYYRGDWKGQKLYRCHLGLWDMTYPLYIGNNLVGILYGGQVVVKDGTVSWRDELSSIEDEVVWGGVPETGNQIDDICNIIDGEKKLNIDQRDEAKRILREQSAENGKNVTVQELLGRYQEFLRFGEMVERLLTKQYDAERESDKHNHIHKMSTHIAKRGDCLIEEPGKFWDCLDPLFMIGS